MEQHGENNNLTTNKIQMILRQTDYSEEKALGKLNEFNMDEILVIKDFLGIIPKKEVPLKSINQEIYKQIRYKLDSCRKDYESRQDENTTQNTTANSTKFK